MENGENMCRMCRCCSRFWIPWGGRMTDGCLRRMFTLIAEMWIREEAWRGTWDQTGVEPSFRLCPRVNSRKPWKPSCRLMSSEKTRGGRKRRRTWSSGSGDNLTMKTAVWPQCSHSLLLIHKLSSAVSLGHKTQTTFLTVRQIPQKFDLTLNLPDAQLLVVNLIRVRILKCFLE